MFLLTKKTQVYVQTVKADWNVDVTMPNGERENIHVVRWQLPLTHAQVRTAMSSQGLTFPRGVLADVRKKGNMDDDIWWLNIYVMLSRARKLTSLILIGLTEEIRKLLEAGPPKYIAAQMVALQQRSKKSALHAERLSAQMDLHLPQ